MHNKFLLATLKKGSKSVTDYYNKAKALAASLCVVGKVLTPSKFTVYFLVGLKMEYDSLVASLTTRAEPLSPNQLYSYLLIHEFHLTH